MMSAFARLVSLVIAPAFDALDINPHGTREFFACNLPSVVAFTER